MRNLIEEACLRACNECAVACLQCATACLQEAEPKPMVGCQGLQALCCACITMAH